MLLEQWGYPYVLDCFRLHFSLSGSRHHLAQALRDFPALQVVHITASPETLRQRLRLRGRETEHDVELRLEREALDVPGGMRVTEIRNDGDLALAGARFLQYLTGGNDE